MSATATGSEAILMLRVAFGAATTDAQRRRIEVEIVGLEEQLLAASKPLPAPPWVRRFDDEGRVL